MASSEPLDCKNSFPSQFGFRVAGIYEHEALLMLSLPDIPNPKRKRATWLKDNSCPAGKSLAYASGYDLIPQKSLVF